MFLFDNNFVKARYIKKKNALFSFCPIYEKKKMEMGLGNSHCCCACESQNEGKWLSFSVHGLNILPCLIMSSSVISREPFCFLSFCRTWVSGSSC